MSDTHLVPWCRKATVFLLEGMESLKAYVHLSRTIELGKICHYELWFSQGRFIRFL